MQKYALGMEVKVEFWGRIVEVKERLGIPLYHVEGDITNCFSVLESQITPFELPKENA